MKQTSLALAIFAGLLLSSSLSFAKEISGNKMIEENLNENIIALQQEASRFAMTKLEIDTPVRCLTAENLSLDGFTSICVAEFGIADVARTYLITFKVNVTSEYKNAKRVGIKYIEYEAIDAEVIHED